MDKKTKNIFLIYGSIIILTIIITYYNVFILHNYKISYELPCNPKLEKCFIDECIDNNCSYSSQYYKIIEQKAGNIFMCNESDFQCLSCKEYDNECNTITCEEEPGVTCSNLNSNIYGL